MNGALVVDKPAGPTSHDVVAAVRRVTGVRRVGHTGTLNPMATGVLVLLFGQATRLSRFLTTHVKTYEASIRLGLTTDTYDITGKPAGDPTPGSARGDRRDSPGAPGVRRSLRTDPSTVLGQED